MLLNNHGSIKQQWTRGGLRERLVEVAVARTRNNDNDNNNNSTLSDISGEGEWETQPEETVLLSKESASGVARLALTIVVMFIQCVRVVRARWCQQ